MNTTNRSEKNMAERLLDWVRPTTTIPENVDLYDFWGFTFTSDLQIWDELFYLYFSLAKSRLITSEELYRYRLNGELYSKLSTLTDSSTRRTRLWSIAERKQYESILASRSLFVQDPGVWAVTLEMTWQKFQDRYREALSIDQDAIKPILQSLDEEARCMFVHSTDCGSSLWTDIL